MNLLLNIKIKLSTSLIIFTLLWVVDFFVFIAKNISKNYTHATMIEECRQQPNASICSQIQYGFWISARIFSHLHFLPGSEFIHAANPFNSSCVNHSFRYLFAAICILNFLSIFIRYFTCI